MQNFTPPICSIWDIDGTLANIDHRAHYVRTKPKNWAAFNKTMVNDTPNWDIVWMLRSFHAAGSTILIASGRGSEFRDVTVNWLDNVANLAGIYTKLYMRPVKDSRPDYVIKGEILDQMILDGFNPTIAVDDRNQVVKLWRDRGLRCLQVQDGDY